MLVQSLAELPNDLSQFGRIRLYYAQEVIRARQFLACLPVGGWLFIAVRHSFTVHSSENNVLT